MDLFSFLLSSLMILLLLYLLYNVSITIDKGLIPLGNIAFGELSLSIRFFCYFFLLLLHFEHKIFCSGHYIINILFNNYCLITFYSININRSIEIYIAYIVKYRTNGLYVRLSNMKKFFETKSFTVNLKCETDINLRIEKVKLLYM